MKKYMIITVIFMIMCLMLSGCKKEEKPESLYDLPITYELVAEIKEDSLSASGCELILTNQGTETEFDFGYYGYKVERYEDGEWSEIPLVNLYSEVIALGYKLNPGDSTEFRADWSELYGELPSGKYRYIKSVEMWKPKHLTQDVCFFIEFTLK